jgi:hypothetical protein
MMLRRRGAMVVPRQWRSALRASREHPGSSAWVRRRTQPRGEQRGPAAQGSLCWSLLGRCRFGGLRLLEDELTALDGHSHGVALGEVAFEEPQR